MPTPWLTGWKAIANHCGVHLSTARRWYYCHGMPVYSLPSGGVAAFPEELEMWVKWYDLIERCRKNNKLRCKNLSCFELIKKANSMHLIHSTALDRS